MTSLGSADAAPASGASEDQRLMISQRMQAPRTGGPTNQTGSWVAAGAIDDTGTATITQAQITPQSDGTALVATTHLLTSRDDPAQMLELESRARMRPFPPPPPNRRVMLEGTCRLVSATRAYANLRANGRLYATITDRVIDDPEPIEIREITLVRDGSVRRAS
jgi:hypothetical protein